MTWVHKGIVIGLVALHSLLLLGYTMPARFVQDKLKGVAAMYTRPIFHQQWQLFAPDPPLCSCEIEVILGQEDPRPLHENRGYLKRRLEQSIARRLQAEVAHGDTIHHPDLVRAMKNMVGDIGREVPGLQFQLRQECVVDPWKPSIRRARVTQLNTVTSY